MRKQSTTKLITKVFWTHARRYPWAVLLSVTFTTLYTLTSIVVPLFFKQFFDAIAGVGGIITDELAPRLFGLVFIIIAIEISGVVFRRIGGFSNLRLEARVMIDLARTSFSYLLRHSYRFFTDNFAGSLVRKVNRLSHAFEDITDQIHYNFIPLLVTLIGSLVVLFYRHVYLGMALLVWIVLFLLINYFIARWRYKYDLARAQKDSEVTGVLADALTNSITIKLFSGYSNEESLYRKVTGELKRLRIFTWDLHEWIDGAQGVLMVAIEFIMFYVAITLGRRGLLTIGDFVLIQVYLLTIFQRLWGFGRILRHVYESMSDAAEMVEILNAPHEIQDHRHAKPLILSEGKIEFKNVDFSFQKTRKALDHFTLTINHGEKIALVGPSGAGKTTVTKLIFRFFDVDGGEILIDGQDIAKVTQDSLHDYISLVPQEPILFHRTLMDNIRYGRRDATEEEVIEAARQAHCHEFISELPERYETYVGERGVKLSGGERQRVAIARAIVKNAPILVLDEATSSLDSESEALIQDALRKLMKGRTTIVIAHRLSTIMQMDRIVVVDEGKVIAMGTHQELLKEQGVYKKLWEIQAGGFIE
jgi:ATP-binding cassette, subfamily B, bacterial